MATSRKNNNGRSNGKTPRTLPSPMTAASRRGAAGTASKPHATGPARSATVESKPALAEVTVQAIAEAAYFLWLKRGGDPTTNWLEAEAALRRATSRR